MWLPFYFGEKSGDMKKGHGILNLVEYFEKCLIRQNLF